MTTHRGVTGQFVIFFNYVLVLFSDLEYPLTGKSCP
jgi:hypothetical protein